MGNATVEANSQLHAYLTTLSTTKVKMGGVVLVKSPGEDGYFSASASYEDGHLETVLPNKMKTKYGDDFSKVPNGETIIFACAWSPCSNCVSSLRSYPDVHAQREGQR